MSSLYTHQAANNRKTWLLMSGFLVIVIAIGWFAAQYFGNSVILYFAVGFSLIMNVTSFWYSDKIVLKMSGAKPATAPEFDELNRIVENLAITAGLPKPKVYVIDDPVPNAFATGRNAEHGVVAATTGLLAIMDRSELEGVIAHELGHIGNKDILISTIVVVLVGFIAILSDLMLRFTIFGDRDSDSGKAGTIMLIVGIALAILAPISASLIQLAISRKREFSADATGALLTRYPEGLASALEKIAAYSGKMKKVSHASAHLYIGDPYGKKKSFMHSIFATHPPVRDRVQALRGTKI